LWSRHLFNCAALSPLIARDASLIDVGSGAGLPGLVLAIARPDLRVTLVDSLERRVTWLRTVVEDLALPVTVIRARAENVPRLPEVEPADVVTARAVAPLTKLVAWTVPLCAPHGVVLAIKGRSAAAEVEAAATALRRARVTAEILVVGTPPIEPITAVRLTRAAR
jgi:16S rRNA (guanine527-N7)-methyltransferase